MNTHHLKTLSFYYQLVETNLKKFEIRKNDRDFKPGDILILHEFDSLKTTGKFLQRQITCIVHGGKFGIDPDYVVLGIEEVNK